MTAADQQEYAYRLLRVSRALRTAATDELAKVEFPEESHHRAALAERARAALREVPEPEFSLVSLLMSRLQALSRDGTESGDRSS